MLRTLAISVVALIGLSGCFATTGPGLAIIGLSTYIITDKTATDHAVTLATGEDCSTLEYSKGRDYCVPDGDRAGVRPDEEDGPLAAPLRAPVTFARIARRGRGEHVP